MNVNVFKDIILKLVSKSPHQLASMTAEDMQHELATATKLITAYYKNNTIKYLDIPLAQSFVHHIEPLTVLLHFTITHTFC